MKALVGDGYNYQLNFYFPSMSKTLDVICPLGWCASREHIDINGYFLCCNWSQTTSLEVARSLITTLLPKVFLTHELQVKCIQHCHMGDGFSWQLQHRLLTTRVHNSRQSHVSFFHCSMLEKEWHKSFIWEVFRVVVGFLALLQSLNHLVVVH
jgi:hypothetical protein